MNCDLAWHVRGVRPQAREAARAAARRRGVAVGEWLDGIICDSALQQGVEPGLSAGARYDPCGEDSDLSQGVRPPCRIDEAVDKLRGNLVNIASPVQDTLPRKAIEALATEVRRLASRVDNSPRVGRDASALARVEVELAEMRDALRAAVPAECIFAMAQALQQLSQRIDRSRGNPQDHAALRQLQRAIVAVHETVTHLASSAVEAKLSEEVRKLAVKIDQAATRIGGGMVCGHPELEAMVRALIDKIERGELARYDDSTLGRLEGLVSKLAEKLEAADARLDHLETVERGPRKPHLEHQPISHISPALASIPTPGLDVLARDVADLRLADKQTQDSLEAVHGTLGHVIDRLAMIETDMRGRPAQPIVPAAAMSAATPAAVTTPSPAVAEELASPVSAGTPVGGPQAPGPGPASAAAALSIDANLSPDHVSQDLSEPPRGHTSGLPADRTSGAEATPRATPPEPSDCGGKSDFIAAARRAVQAAACQAIDDRASAPSSAAAVRRTSTGRIGVLGALIAAMAAVAVAVGGLQIARSIRTASDAAKADTPGGTAASLAPGAPAVTAVAGQAPLLGQAMGLHAPHGAPNAALGIVISDAVSEPQPQAESVMPPAVSPGVAAPVSPASAASRP
jgi:localization factor PodJL